MFRGLKITSTGTNIYTGKKKEISIQGTVMKRKMFEAEAERTASYTQLGMETPKLNLFGQPTAKTLEFEEKYSTPKKILSYWEIRSNNAFNNYINNLEAMKAMADNEDDQILFEAIINMIIKKIEEGELDADALNDKQLYKFSGVNLFDSKILYELRTNAKKIISQLAQAFSLSPYEVIKEVYPTYYEKYHDKLYEKYYNEYAKRFDMSDENAAAEAHIKIEEKVKEEIERMIKDAISRV